MTCRPYAQQARTGEPAYNRAYGMCHYTMDVQANTGILMPTDDGRKEGEMFLRNIATDTPGVWSGASVLNRAGNSVTP